MRGSSPKLYDFLLLRFNRMKICFREQVFLKTEERLSIEFHVDLTNLLEGVSDEPINRIRLMKEREKFELATISNCKHRTTRNDLFFTKCS